MRCPDCAFLNPAEARFCGSCGRSLAERCPSCGSENPARFRFCASCGASLEPAAEPRGAPLALEGERRRVTVLFADLVGFSTLAEHLDPEELRSLMADTFSELTEEVERREGVVEKFIGDAVVAVFGAPVSHEDDPVRAVEAARAMLDIVDRRSASSPSRLELRVGVNSGLVVAGAVGDGSQTGVMGDTVNVAARLQQSASPGEVLLAASTWRRVRDAYEADPIGALEIKGKTQPVEAYRLGARREDGARLLSPFVGRRDELALIELLWSSTRKGNTHVVSIVGEPGVGKSRLLAELEPRPDAFDVRIACGGERAFGPFFALVERVLGGLPGDLAELEVKATALELDREDALLLGAFLGLAGAPPVVRMADEQRLRQVFAGVWRLLLAACRERPVFVALDDAHWLDESSRALLAFLLEQLGGVPILLVLLHRPAARPVGHVELRASHTTIGLEPLTPAESVALARGFLDVSELPDDLERLVATRAEGNPFFIEELLRALLELGSLAVVDGHAVLAKVDVDVPDTVQGTILARVDRLPPRERAVLQRAAVLGRSFEASLLGQIAGGEGLSETLAELARAQILVQQGPGDWAFKHSLIQEVTYDTLLLRQRRELHRDVAEVLEREGGDDPARLESLAEHYARADEREKARRYAVAAGDVARERSGYVEATRRYQAALALWGDGDEEGRLELLTKLGTSALTGAEGSVARASLVEAADGWQRAGKPQRAGEALAVLGRVHWLTGDSIRAIDVLDGAIRMLEPLGASQELVQAYAWASTSQMLLGNVEAATQLAERGLDLAEELGLDGFRSHLLNTLGSSQVFAGQPAGIERIREALALARAAGDPEAIGRGYVNLGSTLAGFGRDREAIEVDREGREVMRTLGAPGFEWFIAANETASLLALGRLDEAEALRAEITEAQTGVTGTPGVVNIGMTGIDIAVRRGEHDLAQGILDQISALARGVGSPEYLGQLLEVVARFERDRGNLAAARQAIRESVELVSATPAWDMWLRTLPTAARLLPAGEAQTLLERLPALPAHPMTDARIAECEGLIHGDPGRSRIAADLYRQLELPYEEARCRVDAGELDRARELVAGHGFAPGAVGLPEGSTGS